MAFGFSAGGGRHSARCLKPVRAQVLLAVEATAAPFHQGETNSKKGQRREAKIDRAGGQIGNYLSPTSFVGLQPQWWLSSFLPGFDGSTGETKSSATGQDQIGRRPGQGLRDDVSRFYEQRFQHSSRRMREATPLAGDRFGGREMEKIQSSRLPP
jgi:hypothetical protein